MNCQTPTRKSRPCPGRPRSRALSCTDADADEGGWGDKAAARRARVAVTCDCEHVGTQIRWETVFPGTRSGGGVCVIRRRRERERERERERHRQTDRRYDCFIQNSADFTPSALYAANEQGSTGQRVDGLLVGVIQIQSPSKKMFPISEDDWLKCSASACFGCMAEHFSRSFPEHGKGFIEGFCTCYVGWLLRRTRERTKKQRQNAVLNRVLIIPADDNKLDKAKSKQKIPPNL